MKRLTALVAGLLVCGAAHSYEPYTYKPSGYAGRYIEQLERQRLHSDFQELRRQRDNSYSYESPYQTEQRYDSIERRLNPYNF